jgi:phage terminase Nu1 subunit (DNA packaging protein)
VNGNCTFMDHLKPHGYLCELFKRSKETIELWRKKHGLPFVCIPGDTRPAIRFDLAVVKPWARRTGRRMFVVKSAVRGAKL